MYNTWHGLGRPIPNQGKSGSSTNRGTGAPTLPPSPDYSSGPQESSCALLLFSSQLEWRDWRRLEVEQKGIWVKPEIFACLPMLQISPHRWVKVLKTDAGKAVTFLRLRINTLQPQIKMFWCSSLATTLCCIPGGQIFSWSYWRIQFHICAQIVIEKDYHCNSSIYEVLRTLNESDTNWTRKM